MTTVFLITGFFLIFFSGVNTEKWIVLGERKDIVKSILEGVVGVHLLLAAVGSVL